MKREFIKRFKQTLLLGLLISGFSYAQADEVKNIESEIKEVTVFLQNAQVVRTANVRVPIGKTVVKLEGLSAVLDPSSIQVQGVGDFSVLSVNHQLNYFNKEKASKQEEALSDSIAEIVVLVEDIQIDLNVLNEQSRFLQTNQVVKGSTSNLDPDKFFSLNSYFTEQYKFIAKERLRLNREKKRLNKLKNKFQNQLNSIRGKKNEYSSDVLIELKANRSTSASLRVSYLVRNAGWTPSYDVRVKSIDQPLELVYKANVYQRTGEDWDMVKLKFSNGNPNLNGNLPKLLPYYLRFGTTYRKQAYSSYSNQSAQGFLGIQTIDVQGRVVDQYGDAIPFATVKVPGTTMGTYSDENGNFNLSLPPNSRSIQIAAIGYRTITQGVRNGNMVFRMGSNEANLDRVAVAREDIEALPDRALEPTYYGYTDGISVGRMKNKALARSANKQSASYKGNATQMVENQTTIEFKIDEPYTIKSNGKPKAIEMKKLSIPANYEYRTVPKLELAAFLIAQIPDWSKYQLLQGQANLYFENTYVGRSLLNVQYVSDTLDISLGRDRSVVVKREKVKEYNSRELIGSDLVAKRQFDLDIRNNKSQKINLVVYDQVPISNMKEVEVTLKDLDGAKHDAKTGQLTWTSQIDGGGKFAKSFKYVVKYPKGNIINLE